MIPKEQCAAPPG